MLGISRALRYIDTKSVLRTRRITRARCYNEAKRTYIDLRSIRVSSSLVRRIIEGTREEETRKECRATALHSFCICYYYFLSTQLAAFAFIQFTSETLLYKMTKTVTEWFYLYSVYYLTNKGVLKQGTSLLK